MRNAFSSAVAGILLIAGTASAQLQGRVVMGGAERSDILVTVETLNGQIIHQAYTSSRGNFRLEGVRASSSNPMYLVVDEEGYKPFRHHIREQDIRGGAAVFTVYLEPEEPESAPAPGADGTTVVDVRQLQADIPEAAVREYQASVEEAGEGDHRTAAEHLERALELAPDYYDAWIDLGNAYDRLERYSDAEAAFLRAREVNPAGALALVNLGALDYQQGERARLAEDPAAALEGYSRAEGRLRQAVELNPVSADARYFLGAALYRLSRLDASEEELKTALSLDDGYTDAELLLINVYARQTRYGAALEQADAFLDAHPEAPERESIERIRAQLEDLLERP